MTSFTREYISLTVSPVTIAETVHRTKLDTVLIGYRVDCSMNVKTSCSSVRIHLAYKKTHICLRVILDLLLCVECKTYNSL